MNEWLMANLWIIIPVLLWSTPWKGIALWRSSRRGHKGWFIVMLILNTLAILDILYIFVFSKNEKSKKPEIILQTQTQTQTQMQRPQVISNYNNRPIV